MNSVRTRDAQYQWARTSLSPGQTIATLNTTFKRNATLLGETCCARLATKLRPVATYWLKFEKWSRQIFHATLDLGMLHDFVIVWPGSCDNVAPGHPH